MGHSRQLKLTVAHATVEDADVLSVDKDLSIVMRIDVQCRGHIQGGQGSAVEYTSESLVVLLHGAQTNVATRGRQVVEEGGHFSEAYSRNGAYGDG